MLPFFTLSAFFHEKEAPSLEDYSDGVNIGREIWEL
jgi:hypothetical protein